MRQNWEIIWMKKKKSPQNTFFPMVKICSASWRGLVISSKGRGKESSSPRKTTILRSQSSPPRVGSYSKAGQVCTWADSHWANIQGLWGRSDIIRKHSLGEQSARHLSMQLTELRKSTGVFITSEATGDSMRVYFQCAEWESQAHPRRPTGRGKPKGKLR